MSGSMTPTSTREGYKTVYLGPRPVSIPKSWAVRKLGSNDVAKKIKAGGTPTAGNEDYYGGGIPFVKIEDMTDAGKFISTTKSHLTEEGLDSTTTWLVPEGALLLSMYGSYGKVAITTKEVATNQAILGILPSESIDRDYLYYAATMLRPYFESVVLETTQANLNKGIVENAPIRFPPLQEQERIGKILSTVDRKVQQTESIIDRVKELKRGLMQDLLVQGINHDKYEKRYLGPQRIKVPKNWKKSRLEDVSEIITRGNNRHTLKKVVSLC